MSQTTENRETVGQLLRRLPKKGAYALMLLLSAAASFYATTLLMVLAGGSYNGLTEPLLLAIWAAILIVVSLIGLAFKNVLATNLVVAALLVAWSTYNALHGTGPVLTWVRPIASYALLPTLSALCLKRLIRSYDQAGQ